MGNETIPQMSFADELRQIQISLNHPTKKKHERVVAAPLAPGGTQFYIIDIFGDHIPATAADLKDKHREIFFKNGDEFVLWQGERPESKPDSNPVVEHSEPCQLPVTVVADQFSDMRLASAFATMFKDVLRYWAETGKWLIFDGHRWTTDTAGGAFPFIRKLIETLYQRAMVCEYGQRAEMLKAIVKLEGHQKQETILAAAKVRPELIVSSSGLDQHPMLLTVNNGTIELKSGVLRSSSADDLLTRMTAIEYDPEAKCPLFLKFLNRIFAGNENLIRYIQRFAGYCLTGMTVEQVLLFFYGLGANGKTVLANILGAVLGDYVNTANSDLLMSRDKRGATNDIAALRGARMVKVSEFDDSEKLSEAQIKTLTGNDSVTCRFLFCENFTYWPSYKILLIGNHKPQVRGTDHGIWRRIQMILFGVTIPENERDPNLQSKLMAELPGILAWAVRGCLEWQEAGLSAPDEIKMATDEYRKSEDIFDLWLDECCTRGEHLTVSAAELLASFVEHSKWKNMTPKKFSQMLSDAGFIKEKSHGTIRWRGLVLPQKTIRHWTEKEDDTRSF